MTLSRNVGMYARPVPRPSRQLRQAGQTWDDFEAPRDPNRKRPLRRLPDPAPSKAIPESRQPQDPTEHPPRSSSAPPGPVPLHQQEALLPVSQQPVPAWNGSLARSGGYVVPAPEGRSRATCVVSGNTLYFFGGLGTMNVFTGSRFRNDIFTFDMDNQEWRRVECTGYFPKARIHHTAVVKDHKMVVYGGINEDGIFLNDMFAISLRDPVPAWKKVATRVNFGTPNGTPAAGLAPPFLCCHSAVIHAQRNSMIVFGGRTAEAISPQLYEFSFASQEWGRVWPPKQAKNSPLQDEDKKGSPYGPMLYDHSAAIAGNKMYVFGGLTYHQGNHSTNNYNIFEFNFGTGLWTAIATTESSVSAFGPLDPLCLVLDKENMNVWACSKSPSRMCIDSDQFLAGQWVNHSPDGDDVYAPVHRAYAAIATDGRKVYVFGGEQKAVVSREGQEMEGEQSVGGNTARSRNFFNDLHSFDLDYLEWTVQVPAQASAPAFDTTPTFLAPTSAPSYLPPGLLPPDPLIYQQNVSAGAQETASSSGGMILTPHSQSLVGGPQLTPIAYQALQQSINADNKAQLSSQAQPTDDFGVNIPMAKPERKAKNRPDPSRRVQYSMSSSHNNPKIRKPKEAPVWKRDYRPQKPEVAPDYNRYYFGDAYQAMQEKQAKQRQEQFRPPMEAGSPINEAHTPNSIHSMASMHSITSGQSAMSAKSSQAKLKKSPYKARTPSSLSKILSGGTPSGVLHSLLQEKYQFDKEKEDLAASSKASRDEVLAYENLLDNVIEEYIAKTESLTVAGPSSLPSSSKSPSAPAHATSAPPEAPEVSLISTAENDTHITLADGPPIDLSDSSLLAAPPEEEEKEGKEGKEGKENSSNAARKISLGFVQTPSVGQGSNYTAGMKLGMLSTLMKESPSLALLVDIRKEQAAVSIQSQYRGFKTRKQHRHKHGRTILSKRRASRVDLE